MITKDLIDAFTSKKHIAIAGVSRSGKKFGNYVYRNLRDKSYSVYAINTNADTIEGDKCYRSVDELPAEVQAIVIITPPEQTEQIIEHALRKGIKYIWLQQGAESKKSIQKAEQGGAEVVFGKCIMMFAEPLGFMHRIHRGIDKLIGKYPK